MGRRLLRSLLMVTAILAVAGTCALLWRERSYRTSPAAAAALSDRLIMSNLHAGGAPAATLPPGGTHEEFSSFDISEGKRLYHSFNCHGCHANGGGGIGPPLMDGLWLYGAEPRNIFATIVEGRPNGMPSFRGKIPDQQVWQLVAYVRTLSGQTPVAMRSSRNDDMQSKPPETLAPREDPAEGNQPMQDQRATSP